MDDIELGAARKKVVVIGAGFAGLSAACSLAKEGFEVTVLERLPVVGGRCRVWSSGGYNFDMGPSWYWMPDVFDDFFASFGRKTSEFYELRRLDPPYRLFLANGRLLDIPDRAQDLESLFENTEPGAGMQFRAFMQQAEYKYGIAMSDYVKRPSLRLTEFMDLRMLREAFRLDMFRSQASHVRSHFKHPDLVAIMEWPVLFLGGSPKNVPAMYSLMNYAAVQLGTWFPVGGMAQVPIGMANLARELGVKFHCGEEFAADRIVVDSDTASKCQKQRGGRPMASGVQTRAGFFEADFVVAAGDYHHMEQDLLEKPHRNLSEEQWDQFVMSPSSLLFYLGVNKRLHNLRHHNLFFDEDLEQHAQDIYDDPKWPAQPLFYVCVQSLSDPTCAPPGHENVFVLIPLAAGLKDSDEMRDKYYEMVMSRLERHTGQSVSECVTLKRAYAMRDFEEDYKSYKGNAYGLANILLQTAVFKPPTKSHKVDNLYFAGQLTVPGPGVPPAIISGQIVAKLISSHAKKGKGERRDLILEVLHHISPRKALRLFLAGILAFLILLLLWLSPGLRM